MKGKSDNSNIGNEYKNFLTPEGERIYNAILGHCESMGIEDNIDTYELSALANSFALYAECAKHCNENGVKMTFHNEKTGGIYEQICPEYTVMKNEYANILKHSSKFGLNPGDRKKIFNAKSDGEKKGNKLKFG